MIGGYLITAFFYAILFHLIKSTYSYCESDYVVERQGWGKRLIQNAIPSVKKRFSILYWGLLFISFFIPYLNLIVSIILCVCLIVAFCDDDYPDYNYRAPKFIRTLLDKKF